jgi:hypothetical protein
MLLGSPQAPASPRPSVSRPSVSRPTVSRPTVSRPTVSRPSVSRLPVSRPCPLSRPPPVSPFAPASSHGAVSPRCQHTFMNCTRDAMTAPCPCVDRIPVRCGRGITSLAECVAPMCPSASSEMRQIVPIAAVGHSDARVRPIARLKMGHIVTLAYTQRSASVVGGDYAFWPAPASPSSSSRSATSSSARQVCNM